MLDLPLSDAHNSGGEPVSEVLSAATIAGAMDVLLKPSVIGTAFLLAVMLMLIALGAYVVGRFRGREEEDQPASSEMLTNFREMHSRGDLDDAEYRTIKTVLATRLRKELSDTDGRG